MKKDISMKGLRRNDDAMKTEAGIKPQSHKEHEETQRLCDI
jgi:hypothetical protein